MNRYSQWCATTHRHAMLRNNRGEWVRYDDAKQAVLATIERITGEMLYARDGVCPSWVEEILQAVLAKDYDLEDRPIKACPKCGIPCDVPIGFVCGTPECPLYLKSH